MSSPRDRPNRDNGPDKDEGVSLAPLTPEDALRALLAAGPDDGGGEKAETTD